MTAYCDQHSGHVENIRELCEFKKSVTASGTGTVDRLWTAIEKKASKGMIITFTIITVGFMATLFGLVYHSNSKVLHEMVSVKSNINLLLEKLK